MNRALAFAVVVLVGCTNTNNNNNDQGIGQLCIPNTQECVSDSLARVCPADGQGWLGVPCADGQICSNGTCILNMAMCKPGTGTCMAGTAMRCKDDGSGYTTTTCGTGTACVEGGLCKGTCVVNSSTCSDLNTVATCADGNSTTPTACTGGQLCVDTSIDSANPTAACMAAACYPFPGDCNSVCGNKLDSSANQTQYVSTCVATKTGYQWQANKCLAPKTCNPTTSMCTSGYGAACSSICNPGDVRCSGDGTGTQTCQSDGTWAAVTSCNLAAGDRCVFNANGSQAACGDAICAAGPGTCDTNGNFRPCVSGRLSSTSAPCTLGVCALTTRTYNGDTSGKFPGQCITTCQGGDRRCVVGSSNFETCVNGIWSVTVDSCGGEAGANNCFNTTTTTGRPDIVCGICQPGSHQCAGTDAGADRGLQLCDSTGQWGATVPCTLGFCQPSYNRLIRGLDATCTASCVPGSKVCAPAYYFYLPGTNFELQNAQYTCQSDGTLGPQTACPGGTGCRHDSGGNSLGCVQCVGSTTNEWGFVDTACSNLAGQPGAGSQAVVTCKSDNTWGSATATACASGVQCQMPTGNIAPMWSYNNVGTPTPRPTAYCHRCYTGSGQAECTESNMLSGYTTGCVANGRGAPVNCGNYVAGAPDVDDCCASFCYIDSQPAPAQCSNTNVPFSTGCGCGCGL
jgi:hypothetical protein